jgi:DNA-directed RNA polymerase alpha subunit
MFLKSPPRISVQAAESLGHDALTPNHGSIEMDFNALAKPLTLAELNRRGELSNRAFRALQVKYREYLLDLDGMSEREVRHHHPNVGRKTAADIVDVMRRYGVRVGPAGQFRPLRETHPWAM